MALKFSRGVFQVPQAVDEPVEAQPAEVAADLGSRAIHRSNNAWTVARPSRSQIAYSAPGSWRAAKPLSSEVKEPDPDLFPARA